MIATNQDERTLGKAIFSSGENQHSLELDAVAFQRRALGYGYPDIRTLMVISACGPGTAVKACCAMLQSKRLSGSVSAYGLPDMGLEKFNLGEHGFKCAQHRLGYDTWHMLAVSKEPGLMPNFSLQAIYAKLRSSAYTTPMLRHWVPWLAKTLADRELLGDLECYGNCHSGLLTATIQELDEAVRAGIVGGHLTFTQEDSTCLGTTTE